MINGNFRIEIFIPYALSSLGFYHLYPNKTGNINTTTTAHAV